MTNSFRDIDASIHKAQIVVPALASIALFTYILWFWFLKDQPLSDSGESWGHFGDFLGGVLNPVIAYAAFYWLTQSVRIQKAELSETRNALTSSAAAQERQAEYARTSVQLNALAALASASAAEIRATQTELQFVVDQISRDPSRGGARSIGGDWLHAGQVEEYLFKKNQRIRQCIDVQADIEKNVNKLLQVS